MFRHHASPFQSGDLRDFLEARFEKAKARIDGEKGDYLLNVGEERYVNHIVDEFRLEPVTFRWDDIQATPDETQVPAERLPFNFLGEPGRSYKKPVYRIHLPFDGDAELIKYRPSRYILQTLPGRASGREVVWEVPDLHDGTENESLRQEVESGKRFLREMGENSRKDVATFNDGLPDRVRARLNARKDQLLRRAGTVAALGIPLKRADDVPNTFSVPAPKRRVIAPRPTASASPFEPHPTMSEETYGDILKIVYDSGVAMERTPSVYAGKDEETLRDHFLMNLAPHFDSAAGETFNSSGKTDILVRHGGENLFVAECKFWHGAKGYAATLDQLLSYLTWRDSKAAVMMFVRNKDLSDVLAKIEAGSPEHPSHLKLRKKVRDGWYDHEFHLPGDQNRAVRVAVMAFHFPPV